MGVDGALSTPATSRVSPPGRARAPLRSGPQASSRVMMTTGPAFLCMRLPRRFRPPFGLWDIYTFILCRGETGDLPENQWQTGHTVALSRFWSTKIWSARSRGDFGLPGGRPRGPHVLTRHVARPLHERLHGLAHAREHRQVPVPSADYL